MVKWKSKHFNDLKPFDIVSLDNLLDRTKQTMLDLNEKEFIQQWREGRAFVKVDTDNLTDPELKRLAHKYNHSNCPYPTSTQIVLRQYRPEYAQERYFNEDNRRIFDGLSSNVNNRDGFIVGGFSEMDLLGCYIEQVNKKYTTGKWIYLEIPYNFIYEHMVKSINNAPLNIAKQFIEECDKENIWDDQRLIDEKITKYDIDYPDWNHDFPLKSFLQVKKEGLLFPCQWWDPYRTAINATHRMVMMGFNKYNIPFVTQVPYKSKKWISVSRRKMFWHEGRFKYLKSVINLNTKEIKFSFTEKEINGEQETKRLKERLNKLL